MKKKTSISLILFYSILFSTFSYSQKIDTSEYFSGRITNNIFVNKSNTEFINSKPENNPEKESLLKNLKLLVFYPAKKQYRITSHLAIKGLTKIAINIDK